MKRQLFLLSFLLMAFQMKALDLSILITQYYADHSPYIEVYLHTVASTVSPLTSDGDQDIAERQVKVRVLFKQAGKIIRYYRKREAESDQGFCHFEEIWLKTR